MAFEVLTWIEKARNISSSTAGVPTMSTSGTASFHDFVESDADVGDSFLLAHLKGDIS
jgi:hypothetical protein